MFLDMNVFKGNRGQANAPPFSAHVSGSSSRATSPSKRILSKGVIIARGERSVGKGGARKSKGGGRMDTRVLRAIRSLLYIFLEHDHYYVSCMSSWLLG
jgi:hypothetical protein